MATMESMQLFLVLLADGRRQGFSTYCIDCARLRAIGLDVSAVVVDGSCLPRRRKFTPLNSRVLKKGL